MTLTPYPIETEDYGKLLCRLVQKIGCRQDFLIGIDGPELRRKIHTSQVPVLAA